MKLISYIQLCNNITRRNFVENVREKMQSYGLYTSKILEPETVRIYDPVEADRLKQDIQLYSSIPTAVYEGVNFIYLCQDKYPGVWSNEPAYDEKQRNDEFLCDIKNSLLFTFPEDKMDRLLPFFQNYCFSFWKLFPKVRKWLLGPEHKPFLERDTNLLFNQLMFLLNYGVAHRVAITPNPYVYPVQSNQLLKLGSEIAQHLQPQIAYRHLLLLASFHTVFLSSSFINAKNVSALILLTTNLLTQTLKPYQHLNSLQQTIKSNDLLNLPPQTPNLITPSNVQPVILFLGQFIKFWKTNSSDLRRICFLLRKILNVLLLLQQPNPLEDSAMRSVVDQVLLILLRLLGYVLERFPLAQRMEEARENPAQCGNPLRKEDQSGRNSVWFETQWLTRDTSVFEVGDELVVEKPSQLIMLTLWNSQILNLVCALAVRFEKDTITEETLLRISNCILSVFRIVKQHKQPKVPKMKCESKIGAFIDDALKEVAISLQNFPCSQMTFLINRIMPVYIDLLLENRYLENILPYFRKPLALTLFLYYVFEEVSNRLIVAIRFVL